MPGNWPKSILAWYYAYTWMARLTYAWLQRREIQFDNFTLTLFFYSYHLRINLQSFAIIVALVKTGVKSVSFFVLFKVVKIHKWYWRLIYEAGSIKLWINILLISYSQCRIRSASDTRSVLRLCCWCKALCYQHRRCILHICSSWYRLQYLKHEKSVF